jgi:uncharacterized protein YbbC (DUF1343 family)
MSSEPEFYTNSIPWAEELQRSYQDYMDGCESHIYDEESEFETLSTLPFCGCQTSSISMGQGTSTPYQCFGSPAFDWGNYNFTPISIKGVSEKPKCLGITCVGFNLTWYGDQRAYFESEINLNYLVLSYRLSKNKADFFNDFIDKLAGTNSLRKQIIEGKTVSEIRQSWQSGLDSYKIMRNKYLLYP